jgi:glycine/D-amino acid oxidase-like deaminating enzyme
VRIETGTRFLGLERGPQGWLARTDRGDRAADRVLLAMGAWNAGFLLSAFGLRMPAQLRVNQLMVSEPVEAFVPHVVTNVSETLTLKQLPVGTFVIGGGWQGLQDFEHGRTWPARESMAGNARAAVTLIPALRELNIVRAWARFDVKTPDKLPLVGGVTGQEDLFVAGTGHAGLTFGPAAARAAAGLIAGQLDETEIAAWRPDRPAVVISEHAPAAAPAGAAAGEG